LAWSCATYEDYTATVLWPGAGPFYEEILTVLGLEVGHLRGYTAILFSAHGLEKGHLRGLFCHCFSGLELGLPTRIY